MKTPMMGDFISREKRFSDFGTLLKPRKWTRRTLPVEEAAVAGAV